MGPDSPKRALLQNTSRPKIDKHIRCVDTSAACCFASMRQGQAATMQAIQTAQNYLVSVQIGQSTQIATEPLLS
jgi:hypothetical protein